MARLLRPIERIGRGLFLAALFFIIVLCGVAQAEDLVPASARRMKLDPLSASTYYTVEKDGFRVVTTIMPDSVVEKDVYPPPALFAVMAGQR